MPETPEVHRDLGAHAAEIANLKEEMKEVRAQLTEVLAILNQTKGSWRTLVVIAGASSAVGAVLAKFLPLLLR